MILTVTLNPALDVSYGVDALVPHGSHRVRSIVERAGGKGVNVASVLHDVGVPCTTLVLARTPTAARPRPRSSRLRMPENIEGREPTPPGPD